MKLFALTAGLAACAIALPAAAQSMTVAPTEGAAPAAWWNPMGYAHDSYVEVDGGTTFEGRVKRMSTAEGVEPSSRSAKLSGDVFASALVGHNLTPSIAFELEGIYMRDHYNYTTPALAAIGDRARREYGGLGNVKLSSPYVAHLRQFAIVPYIAGGIGYGNVEYDSSTSRGATDGFIWQAKAGLDIKTGTPLSFNVGYRYLAAPDYETPGAYNGVTSSAQVKSYVQAATLGVRYDF